MIRLSTVETNMYHTEGEILLVARYKSCFGSTATSAVIFQRLRRQKVSWLDTDVDQLLHAGRS